MSRARVRAAFAAIVLLGLAARLVAWRTEPALHADEYFQSLEPPWIHLHGAGLEAWEWKDGIRPWVLPGYQGAWMALLDSLGVSRGATLASLVQLHWLLVNLLLLWAAFRGGALLTRRLGQRPEESGWQGGLLAALLCALFAPLVSYAGHTLTEMPAMLCFVFALVLTAELVERPERDRQRALAIGALLSLGVCVRVASLPLAAVPPLWLALRRPRALGWMLAGAVPPVLLFGVVDLLTWGDFLGSYVRYIRFNFIDGRAADFGVRPWSWYFQRLHERLPSGLWLLLVPLLLGARASWPFALSSLGLLLLLSTQGHKEERFVISVWPFALIGAAGTVGAWLARAPHGWPRRLGWAATALAVAWVVGESYREKDGGDFRMPRAWLDAQAFAGDDPAATGLIMEQSFLSGGALWFGRPGPVVTYDPALLDNPLFSHVLVPLRSEHDRFARSKGFVPMFWDDGVVLLRRR
jgi:phosphatidylinositol glycan class B